MDDSRSATEAATILVVDDDGAVTSLLKSVLLREGYKVQVAGNGREAVQIAQETKPDLIIMDIIMPQMDGYEAVSIIKQEQGLDELPIIFLSCKTAEEDAGRSFATGGLAYIRKPFSVTQIQGLVNLVLQPAVNPR